MNITEGLLGWCLQFFMRSLGIIFHLLVNAVLISNIVISKLISKSKQTILRIIISLVSKNRVIPRTLLL